MILNTEYFPQNHFVFLHNNYYPWEKLTATTETNTGKETAAALRWVQMEMH